VPLGLADNVSATTYDKEYFYGRMWLRIYDG
jgi:hypothetical protein